MLCSTKRLHKKKLKIFPIPIDEWKNMLYNKNEVGVVSIPKNEGGYDNGNSKERSGLEGILFQ